jgi:hypothetical protein
MAKEATESGPYSKEERPITSDVQPSPHVAAVHFASPTPALLNGFDARWPWQMVPLNGSRELLLVNGAGLRLQCPPGISIAETTQTNSNRRLIEVRGGAKGQYTLDAVGQGGNVRARVEIAVLPEVSLPLAHFILSDTAGHSADTKKHPMNEAIASDIHSRANRILSPQANVNLVFRLAKPVTAVGDLGEKVPGQFGENAVNVDDDQTRSTLTMLANTNGGAGAHDVFYVWLAMDHTHDIGLNALTRSHLTLMNYLKYGQEFAGGTLAHESVHVLDRVSVTEKQTHDSESKNNLMYPGQRPPHGLFLPKSRILKINPV